MLIKICLLCHTHIVRRFRKPEDAKRCMKTGGVQILGKEVEIAGSHDAPVTAHKPANQGMFGELDDEGMLSDTPHHITAHTTYTLRSTF